MKNYIVLVAGKTEYKYNSLKAARDIVRSMMNINQVKGIVETIEIYKEVTRRVKIDEVKSTASDSGKVDKVFAV